MSTDASLSILQSVRDLVLVLSKLAESSWITQGKNRDNNLTFILEEFWVPVKTTKGHSKKDNPIPYSFSERRRVRKAYKLQTKYKLGEEHTKPEQHGIPNGVAEWQVLWEGTGSEIFTAETEHKK